MNTITKVTFITALFTLMSGFSSVKAQSTNSLTDSLALKPKNNSNYALIDNTVINKNMFFGMNFGNNIMNQLYLEEGNKNFLVAAWTNYDTKLGKMVEVDVTAGYKGNISLGEKTNLTLQPMVGYYTFPNSTMGDCSEVYLKSTLTSPVVDVNARIGQAFGEDSGNGEMTQLVISKTLKPSDKISITGSVETVYNSNYFSGAEGFSHAGAGLTITYTPLENLTITGKINTQKSLDSDFEGLVNTENYGSIGLTYVLPIGK